jgi:hypothetical protein
VRQLFCAPLLVLLALALAGPAALAQDDTPGGEPAARDQLFGDTLGLPVIRIRATDAGFEGVPAEVPAGRYVVDLANQTAGGALVGFVQLPAGKTLDDLQAAYAPVDPPPPGSIDWIYETYSPGGVGTFVTGQRVQAVVDLWPGSYGVAVAGPEEPQRPLPLAVTEGPASPVAMAEPTADATLAVTAGPDANTFSLEGQLVSGPQVLRIRNVAEQAHHVQFIRSPAPVTREQVAELFRLLVEGEPVPPELPSPETWVPVAFAGPLSTGATQWLAVDLDPGSYLVACFVTDPESGQPHAIHGELDVLTVGDPGTPIGATSGVWAAARP